MDLSRKLTLLTSQIIHREPHTRIFDTWTDLKAALPEYHRSEFITAWGLYYTFDDQSMLRQTVQQIIEEVDA